MTARSEPRRAAGLVLALALVLTLLPATQGLATVGEQGCTPGYWKNHHEAWEYYAPTMRVSDAMWMFGDAWWLANHDEAYAQFGSLTLAEALQGGGGPGLTGATRILLRAATAALLNVAKDDVYYFTVNRPQIVKMVNDALKTEDRGTILDVAAHLDDLNNGVDGCPL